MELLVERELTATPSRLERLHQAILFYSDTVRVRATMSLPQDMPEVGRRLNELREIGALTTWAHEYEIDGNGRVRTSVWPSPFGGPVDLVVPIDAARELVRTVDAELEISGAARPPDQALRDGIAELVQFRRSLIRLRLMDSLAADGLLTSDTGGSSLVEDVQAAVVDDYLEDVTSIVVDLCVFGRLSDLPIKAIVDCRRHMPAFRRHLTEAIATGGHRQPPAELAQQIYLEYQNLLEHSAQMHPLRDGAADIAWDVVGAVLPPVVVLKYLAKPLSWSKHRRDFRPFMLLSKIRRAHSRPQK